MKFSFTKKEFIEQDIQSNKLAIIASDFSLTWSEFNLEVYKLTELLSELQIPKGHPVLIYGHKEAHFIVAKTALIMYGCPYVPADYIFPDARIKMMQEECKSEVLISCQKNHYLSSLFPVNIAMTNFEHSKKKEINFTLNHLTSPEDPIIYVLFTSGSTGRPKGVPISMKGVNSLAEWISSTFNIFADDVILNVSALSFDFASFEEYLFLSLGNTLFLTSNSDIKSSDIFIEKIKKSSVSVWVSTPSLVFMYLMEPLFCAEVLTSIKSFVFAGESLPLSTVKKLQQRFPKAKIWNAYGPTEATNLTTAVELSELNLEELNAIPIGYPKVDSEIILLNKDSEEIGEICIIGDHVSNGYLNNEALNSEKFFLHNGKKAYKSGDLGYFKNNLLFYAGRNDEMVKLHGYRIELEDITSQLKNFNSVTNAHTIGLKNKGETKKIVSFFTSNESINMDDLKNHLSVNLPEYMIPSAIIQLDEIPLNVSDKVDVKMLEQLFFKK